MRYEMMLPHQIREAIDQNWPLVLRGGIGAPRVSSRTRGYPT